MTQRSVEIAIRARDEASATLGQIESRIGGFARTAQMALRIGGAVAAARMAAEVLQAVSKAARGDWEGVSNAIGSIPTVGAPAVAFAGLLDEHFLGIGASIRKMKEDLKGFQDYAQGGFNLAKTEVEWKRRARLLEAPPEERERLAAEQEAEKEKSRILEEARSAGLGPQHLTTKATLRAVDEWLEGRKKQIAELKRIRDEEKRVVERRKEEEAGTDWGAWEAEEKPGPSAAEKWFSDAETAVREIRRRTAQIALSERDRELDAIDEKYEEEQRRWRGHADVLAAIQDAWHAERAKIALRHQKEEADGLAALREEVEARGLSAEERQQRAFVRRIADLKAQFAGKDEAQRLIRELEEAGPEGERRAAGGSSRGAPALVSRMLRGTTQADPVQTSNRLLERIAKQLEQDARRAQSEGAYRSTVATVAIAHG